MSDILSFVLEYKHELIEILVGIIVIIITLCKKKVKVFDNIKTDILEVLPVFIAAYEKPGNGKEKLKEVLSAVNIYLGSKYKDFKYGIYDDFITENIEKILSTPKKKEVS